MYGFAKETLAFYEKVKAYWKNQLSVNGYSDFDKIPEGPLKELGNAIAEYGHRYRALLKFVSDELPELL